MEGPAWVERMQPRNQEVTVPSSSDHRPGQWLGPGSAPIRGRVGGSQAMSLINVPPSPCLSLKNQ